MTECFIYYEPYSDIRGEIDMVSFKHYKWKVVPAALKGLHNNFGRGETFNSQTIAREASKLGRSNSELTSRQIGAVLRFYESRGWVASRVVREDNCKRKLWYITENGYKISDWQPKNTNNSNLE
jgi:hypothetical protein|tara:strand:- start:113 stop:484 length:372 start_codon:yes stop_codon:yes gene_type:complete